MDSDCLFSVSGSESGLANPDPERASKAKMAKFLKMGKTSELQKVFRKV